MAQHSTYFHEANLKHPERSGSFQTSSLADSKVGCVGPAYLCDSIRQPERGVAGRLATQRTHPKVCRTRGSPSCPLDPAGSWERVCCRFPMQHWARSSRVRRSHAHPHEDTEKASERSSNEWHYESSNEHVPHSLHILTRTMTRCFDDTRHTICRLNSVSAPLGSVASR
jgi:hypothetical protein